MWSACLWNYVISYYLKNTSSTQTNLNKNDFNNLTQQVELRKSHLLLLHYSIYLSWWNPVGLACEYPFRKPCWKHYRSQITKPQHGSSNEAVIQYTSNKSIPFTDVIPQELPSLCKVVFYLKYTALKRTTEEHQTRPSLENHHFMEISHGIVICASESKQRPKTSINSYTVQQMLGYFNPSLG